MSPRALIFTIALAGCTPSPPPPSAPVHAAAAPRDDLPGLSNFARVSDSLYRGAQPDATGFRTLKSLGIKTVVNLRSAHSDRPLLAGLGMGYVEIPSHAWSPKTEVVAEVLAIARDPANQPVFVHCQHGADRTGYTVASYRIVEQAWDKPSALAELRTFRFHGIWGSIPSFLEQLDVARVREVVAGTAPPPIEHP